jgi:hypothetical protein
MERGGSRHSSRALAAQASLLVTERRIELVARTRQRRDYVRVPVTVEFGHVARRP